ncbi:MAG TPA: class I SAM-dependent methyltransferase [Dongiaceae bacterium]|nr:class I SAM-dependent methyltransferase [Dongiaceae bacterium]
MPGDRFAGLLPAELIPLFDDRFALSCTLFEEYVHRLALRVVLSTGLDTAAREPGTPAAIAARAGLDPVRSADIVQWLLVTLALSGRAARVGDSSFQIPAALPDLDPEEQTRAQERHDPSALPSYKMAAAVAALYPEVLRGTVSGEAALFAPDRIGAWFDYFSNDNVIYAISNRLGAIAAARLFANGGGAILELGGGLGSGTVAVLERLDATGRLASIRSYRLTEIAPSFLRRAQRRLVARFPAAPLVYGRLDMDRPFAEAGIEEGAFALVYGVNTLHVARDLEFTLGEIRRALAPGGAIVLSECLRPFHDRPIYVEFLFNLLEAFRAHRPADRWRPDGGFLTPEAWVAALEAGGFRDARVYPDIARIREVCPAFVVGAITAVRA